MKKSKLGILFVGLYILFIGGLFAYVEFLCQPCQDALYRGFTMLIPALPWIFYAIDFGFGYLGYLMSIIINVVIIYFIGAGVQKVVQKIYNQIKER